MSVENKKVSWQVFVWAMGIILIVIGWTFMRTNASDEKAQKALDLSSESSGNIKVLVNDVQWIKQMMEKQYKLESVKLQSNNK